MDLMLTESDAKRFAEEWIAAWNSHDLDLILSHYAEHVTLTSPVAAKILNDPSGTVKGRSAMREYFKRGLDVYQDLRFELQDVMFGLSSIVLCYRNQKGTKTAEFMELSPDGKIVRVIANYSA